MGESSSLAQLRARILHAKPAPVLFLGAGASIASGGRSAANITEGLLLKIYPGAASPGGAAEIFRQQYGISATFESVLDKLGATPDQRRSLLAPFFSQMVPSQGYAALAMAIHYGYFQRRVFTTNFDSMMELAFADLNSKYGFSNVITTVVEGDVIPEAAEVPVGESGPVIIVKLHGSLDAPHAPLRATYQETANLPPEFEGLVKEEVEAHGMVVIGYRLKDVGLRNCLQLAGPSRGSLSIILPDPSLENDPDTTLLLEKYGSQQRIDATFDAFATYLAGDLQDIGERARVGTELVSCWRALHEALSFGGKRQAELSRLADRARLWAESGSTEVRAFQEAVSYNQHPRGESYRLGYIIELLRKSRQTYVSYVHAAGEQVVAAASMALAQQLRDYYFLVPADEGERRGIVEEIATICRDVADEDRLPPLMRAVALVLVAEAEKERAMVTSPLSEARHHFTLCREACEGALDLFGDDESFEAALWRGVCLRHLAISYEQDANASADRVYREQMYRLWMDYSDRAVETLSELGEDAVRGYALMNRASGYSRLSAFELPGQQRHNMLKAGEKDLIHAVSALSDVEDDRGLVWAYMHLSENLRNQRKQILARPGSDAESADLLRRGEIAAAAAVSHSRLISDSLAIALAKREMGVAWADSRNREEDSKVRLRLKTAERLLWESAEDLELLGYFRGAGHASAELSRLYWNDWESAADISALASGIRACASAIASMGVAFSDVERLVTVFRDIRRELDRFLDI